MLALADAGTAALAALSFAFLGPDIGAAAGALLVLPGWILAAKLYGLYDRDHRTLRHLTVDELPIILAWAITCVAGLAVFLDLAGLGSIDTWTTVRTLAIVFASSLALRGLARSLWRRTTPRERVLVVGSDRLTQAIRRKLELFPDIHAEVVDEYASLRPTLDDRRGALGTVDRVVVALDSVDQELVAELVSECRRLRVKLSIVPPARGLFGTAVQLHHIADLPVVEYNTWDVSRSTLLLKRGLDLLIAGTMLLLALPVLLMIFVAIRLSGSGAAFYVQTRVGLAGREFRMFKFRTMASDAEALLPALVSFEELDEPVFKLYPDPRVTRLGRLLRRTSLDELPQLLNVLRGDMSLVGPRPEQVELVRLYRPHHRFRLTVKPGLTGPMQVFGRGKLSLEERLAVEREYIEDLSISRDLRILALTIPSILHGNGAE